MDRERRMRGVETRVLNTPISLDTYKALKFASAKHRKAMGVIVDELVASALKSAQKAKTAHLGN